MNCNVKTILMYLSLCMTCSCSPFSKQSACAPCVCPPCNSAADIQGTSTQKVDSALPKDAKSPPDNSSKNIAKSNKASVPAGDTKIITINIKSDPQLNLYQKHSHTLYLCTYQLLEPNAFNQIADEDNGISKLMGCGRFDSSVAYSKRLVVQPGESFTDVRGRAEGARYLGIVAGYYSLHKDQVLRLYPMPTPDSKSFSIDLDLGAREIQGVKVK